MIESYVMNEMIYESLCMHTSEHNIEGKNGVLLHDLLQWKIWGAHA